jgi:precorrin-2 dehydrogenase / sirohydrochlorin ferrochelatase
MGYLPIFLDVTGRRCVVIGGGTVAERKIESLLDAGADVTVISPATTETVRAWAAARRITHDAREYRRGDLIDATLVFAATDDPELHRQVAEEAREGGIPINVVDVPERCSFIVPAVASRGELQIAVSTSGAAPAFAARVRRELEAHFGPEYALTLEILRGVRAWLRPRVKDQRERARIMKVLADSKLPAHLADGDVAAVDRILTATLGKGANLTALGIRLDSITNVEATRAAR